MTVTSTPEARRPSRATWRDPRLALGIVVLTGSVVLGASLLGGADDAVPVWAVDSDLPEGAPVTAADLERRDVRLPGPGLADRYLSAEAAPPAGMVLLRDVGEGELLPRAALGDADAEPLVEVPVAVAAEAVPVTVSPGSVVDVWVSPPPTAAGDREELRSVRVFDDVVVVAAPRAESALGPAATRQLIVGVAAADEDTLAAGLARISAGEVVVVKQG